ncbi:MAG TPA: PLP-dependent aminotransferase family protein [Candidatus Bathyarchaeia archaeon]|nr:PLP-dependent aminotransferase family protein [Candidatus Bathyarchaeia archaeon]
MGWKPDRHAHTPIYIQIVKYMEQRISTGEYPAGSKLPSERALAKELKVNRSTIVAAYDELRASGLIESKHGTGTVVSADIWGLSHARIPNWQHLVQTGSFLPNHPLIRQMRKEMPNNDWIDFANGELAEDLIPNAALQRLLANNDFHFAWGYEHILGNSELRETIASHMQTFRKIESTSSSILITSGAQQAIHLIVQCLLQPGDAVAIEDPSYCYSLPIFQTAGLRTFLLPVDQDGINPDDLERLHREHRVKMVFLNPNFQNPTGSLLSYERRLRILELATAYGIPVIEDDPYSLTSFQGDFVPTLKSLDRHGTVLYISSLSKIVASGLRIGWVVGPDSVIERLADAKQQIDFGQSFLPQWMAKQFLASAEFDDHLHMLRQELEERKEMVLHAFQQVMGERIHFYHTSGGIHLWGQLQEHTDEFQLLREGMKRGVVFMPGRVLGSQEGFIRLTYGRVQKERIYEGAKRFADAWNRL